MIDLSHNSGLAPGHVEPVLTKGGLIEGINDAIDAGLQRARSREAPRHYIGGSRLGEECARMLALEYLAAEGKTQPPEPWSGLMLRVFDAGHQFETLTIRWLRQAGFLIRDRLPNGLQFRFSQAGGRISGGIDGVIVAGPLSLPYPLLLEHKTLNSASWNKLKKAGLRSYSDVYYGQAQSYMAYFSLEHCLFAALNKNDQQLYWELVAFDAPTAQRLSDRAVDILRTVDAGQLPPRIAQEPTHFKCKTCKMREECWR